MNHNIRKFLSNNIDTDLEKYKYEILDSSIPFIFTVDEKQFLCHTIPILIGETTFSVFILEDMGIFDFLANSIFKNKADAHTFISRASVSYIVYEMEVKVLDFGKNISQLLNYSESDIPSLRITDFDAALTTKELQRLITLSRDKNSIILQRMFKTAHGGFKPVLIYLSVLKKNNKKRLLFIIQPTQDHDELEFAVKHRLLYDGIINQTKSILFGPENDTHKINSLIKYYFTQIQCERISLHFVNNEQKSIQSVYTSDNNKNVKSFSNKLKYKLIVPWLK